MELQLNVSHTVFEDGAVKMHFDGKMLPMVRKIDPLEYAKWREYLRMELLK